MHQEPNVTNHSGKIIYAVIDTNVIVSALWSRHNDSPPVRVIEALFQNRFIPLYHPDIMNEYINVLYRDKFKFNKDDIVNILAQILRKGIIVPPTPTDEIFPDKDDIIFYEIAMSKREDDALLITGNDKHYPKKHYVVTPKTMMDILDGKIDPSELHD